MSTPSPHARAVTVSLMAAFSMMNYLDRNIMSIAGPEIMKEFSLEPTRIGMVYSAFLLAYAAFMMPGGQLADRIGPRNGIALVGVGTALFTLLTPLGAHPGLTAIAGLLPALLTVRFLMGLFSAPLYPSCGRMCSQLIAPSRLGRVQGLIIGASSIGGAIAPILFQWLMSRFGWRTSFLFAGGATAILAAAWILAAPAIQVAPRNPAAASPWRALLTNRNLMLVTASYAALGYFSYLFYYWIYYYFGEIRHMGFEQGAKFATIVFIVNGLMIPLGGALSDRLSHSHGESIGRRMVPIAGLLSSIALLVAGTMTASDWATVTLFAFSMGCASVCEGPFWALAIRIGGEQAGAACSILNTGANVTGLIAPVLTPAIAAWAGWTAGLYFGCFILLLGALACLAIRVR